MRVRAAKIPDWLFTENDAYYIVGYRVPAPNKPNSTHRIEVKVNRPKVEVRTRRDKASETVPVEEAALGVLKTLERLKAERK